jgi:hypothetical protein
MWGPTGRILNGWPDQTDVCVDKSRVVSEVWQVVCGLSNCVLL